MSRVLRILLIGCAAWLQACGNGMTREDAQFSGDISCGLPGFQKTIWSFARSHACIGCHGVDRVPRFALADAETAYRDARSVLNLANLDDTAFIRKTTDGHCGSDCTTDGSAMKALVHQWGAGELACSSGSGGGSGGLGGTGGTTALRCQGENLTRFLASIKAKMYFLSCVTCHTSGSGKTSFNFNGTDQNQCLTAFSKVNQTDTAASPLLNYTTTSRCTGTALDAEAKKAWKGWADEAVSLPAN